VGRRYTLTHSLQGLNLVRLAGIGELLLVWLAPVIHLGTLMMVPPAPAPPGWSSRSCCPESRKPIGLWELWPATATLSHPLALMCAMWLALLAIKISAQIVFVSRRAPHSLTHRVEMKPLPKQRRP
jgi:hypothetical protein